VIDLSGAPADGHRLAGGLDKPVVRLSKVSRTFGADPPVHALRDVDLAIWPGEWVSIVGPSGSGKSTLLNIVGLLDRQTAGMYRLVGVDVAALDDLGRAGLRGRTIGFVFQAFHLLPELTGLENVLLPARLNGRRASLTRGVELVERLGLTAAAERLPAVLSGGEQQRLAIARALVNDPLLVLADEPTGNLDTESGETVLELLRAIADEGRAVLLVTHEREATARADRVLRLEEGRLR
jgi:putative ABC transport system ATP-binding protein